MVLGGVVRTNDDQDFLRLVFEAPRRENGGTASIVAVIRSTAQWPSSPSSSRGAKLNLVLTV